MKIMIGVPSYSWSVKIGTMRSLLADCLSLSGRGDTFTLYDEAGNTEISLAREAIVKHFLASGCDFLFFIDDDVSWEKGAMLRLLDHPVDVVAGIYPKRKDPLEWPIKWPISKELWADPETGLLEVEAVPTGFLRLSRPCLEAMHREFGDAMFDNIRHASGRFSEDISFCARWRSIGGKVWIDPEIKMGHIGNKVFAGSIGEWLRNR